MEGALDASMTLDDDQVVTGVKDFTEPFRVGRFTWTALQAKVALEGAVARVTDKWRGLALRSKFGWHSLTHKQIDAYEFGAICDGASHPLSERYADLAAAQVDYPFLIASDYPSAEIDWAAIQAALNVHKEDGGGAVRVDGFPVVNRRLVYATSGEAQGLIVKGTGERRTIFDNRVVDGFLFDIDGSLVPSQFAFGTQLKGFQIATTTSPANSGGIRLKGLWNADLDHITISGLSDDAIELYTPTAGVDAIHYLNGTHLRLVNNGGWGVDHPIPATGAPDAGTFRFRHCMFDNNALGNVTFIARMLAITSSTFARTAGVSLHLNREPDITPQGIRLENVHFDGAAQEYIWAEGASSLCADGCQFVNDAAHSGPLIRVGSPGGTAETIGQIEIIRPYVRNDVAGAAVLVRVEENVTQSVRIIEPWVQGSTGTFTWLEAANSTVSHLAEVVYQGRRMKASANDIAEQVSVVTDVHPRLRYRASGLIEMGGGAAAPDVNLFRGAANLLKTDDAFEAASGVFGGQAAVVTNDARLSDERVPTDESVTNAKVATGANIAQSKIAALVDDLAAKATPADITVALAAASVRSIKPSDQNVVDTTVVDVSALSFAIGENETWEFEALVLYDATAANDLGLSVSVPAGATVVWGGSGAAASVTSNTGVGNWNAADSGLLNFGGARAAGAARVRLQTQVRGLVINGATAGVVQLRARKVANTDATSPADDCVIYANSFIRAAK